MKWTFKEEHSLESRCKESAELKARHPNSVPVIVQKRPEATSMPDLDKQAFLEPGDLSLAQFMYIIRERISLPPEEAMFLFIDEVLPTTSASLLSLYEEHRDEDGFMYVSYSNMNEIQND